MQRDEPVAAARGDERCDRNQASPLPSPSPQQSPSLSKQSRSPKRSRRDCSTPDHERSPAPTTTNKRSRSKELDHHSSSDSDDSHSKARRRKHRRRRKRRRRLRRRSSRDDSHSPKRRRRHRRRSRSKSSSPKRRRRHRRRSRSASSSPKRRRRRRHHHRRRRHSRSPSSSPIRRRQPRSRSLSSSPLRRSRRHARSPTSSPRRGRHSASLSPRRRHRRRYRRSRSRSPSSSPTHGRHRTRDDSEAPHNGRQRTSPSRHGRDGLPLNGRMRAGSVRRFPVRMVRESIGTCMDYGQLAVTGESAYSSLRPCFFDQVEACMRLETRTMAVDRIVDATAHIGCDTLFFAHLFPRARVDSVELDAETVQALRINVANAGRVLRGQAHADVRVWHESCVDFLTRMQEEKRGASFVYFDPPWGGPDYYLKPLLSLFLGPHALGDVVGRTLQHVASLVVLKAPVNMNLAELQQQVRASVDGRVTYARYDVVKKWHNQKGRVAYVMHFIRIEKSPLLDTH